MAPLAVDADLTVAVDDTSATVTSTGDRLFVEFPSLSAAVATLDRVSSEERRAFHDALLLTDLGLEVRVGRRTVGLIGAGARPGLASSVLGLAPVEVRPSGVLAAVGQRLRNLFARA